jgi:hypothetical protein
MLLADIQNGLAALYETPMEHCVTDFLVTDADVAAALDDAHHPHANAERLLLRQCDDSLDISLYIDAGILEALADSDPYERLGGDNLNDFLIALEGVSHFNYVIWNALHSRQVTQLELELQAEVDKYVTALMLLDEQGAEPDAGAFHDTLFEAVVFATGGSAGSERRYREANRYAGKYCHRLSRRYPGQHREPSFINELRRFYRLPQNEKIRRIERH